MSTPQPQGPLEDWIGLQIRVAQERGDFDNLPGTGKPIPDLDKPWTTEEWLARWAKREGADVSLALPPSLRLRKEREQLPELLAKQRTEQAVRDVVSDFNTRLRQAYLRPQEGPPLALASVDVVKPWPSGRARAPARLSAAMPERPPPPLARHGGDAGAAGPERARPAGKCDSVGRFPR